MMEFRSDFTVQLVDKMGSDASLLAAMMVSTKGVSEAEEMCRGEGVEATGRLEFLMKNRHGTPFEHGAMTFLVEAPIAVFREWHRHRIGFSYNEESGRYKQLAPVFYVPPPHRPLVQEGKPGHYEFVEGDEKQYSFMRNCIENTCRYSYDSYERMLAQGVAKEVARGVLPVYIFSSMYVTCNPRSLMAFLSLRSKDPNSTFPSFPMWEIEQCAIGMEDGFKASFPITHAAFRRFGSVCP